MERLKKFLESSSVAKYAVVLVLAGLILLLLPGKKQSENEEANSEEMRLETLLCQIEGVGDLKLLLSEKGAAIVCSGADNAETRLEICRAVACYTGLDSNKIQIFKMEVN